MKKIYLFFAIIGAVLPYIFFFQFISMEGINLTLFIQSLFLNGPSSGFSVELLLSSVVFWIYMFSQRHEPYAPKAYWFVILNLAIGLSCALPAYLYAKELNKEKNVTPQ
jgi:hypothetical protein